MKNLIMTMSLRKTMMMRKLEKMKTWNKTNTTTKRLMMKMIKSKSRSMLVEILIKWTD